MATILQLFWFVWGVRGSKRHTWKWKAGNIGLKLEFRNSQFDRIAIECIEIPNEMHYVCDENIIYYVYSV